MATTVVAAACQPLRVASDERVRKPAPTVSFHDRVSRIVVKAENPRIKLED
jgi:hypothetical protein